MAHEKAGLVGQGVDFLDRLIERGRIAAGEVAAGGAEIRHGERVADKGRIADMVDHAGGRMARRPDRLGVQSADLEGFPIGEEVPELRAVTGKTRFGIEQVAEHFLDVRDMAANADLAAQLFL